MNLNDLYEMRDRRNAYQRDHDNSVSGMGRGRDHRGYVKSWHTSATTYKLPSMADHGKWLPAKARQTVQKRAAILKV